MIDTPAAEEYQEFIRRVRAGDARAAEELVRRYEQEIRLEVRVWLRLRDPRLRRVLDSIDICQSVMASFFVRAAVGDYDLDEPRQLIGLLVKMARNKVAEQARFHHRQRRDLRRHNAEHDPAVEVAVNQESPSEIVQMRELLQQVRERLSDEERLLADLRMQGLDWEAVAARAGGTAEARRKQLGRAAARVSRELGLDESLE